MQVVTVYVTVKPENSSQIILVLGSVHLLVHYTFFRGMGPDTTLGTPAATGPIVPDPGDGLLWNIMYNENWQRKSKYGARSNRYIL
jgi:hypothetical protein